MSAAFETTASRVAEANAAAEAQPDAAAWALLVEAETLESFGQAWIVLAARSAQSLERAALLIGPADRGPFHPVARWSRQPDGAVGAEAFVENLRPVLDAALAKRRPALQGVGRTGPYAGGSTLVAYPVLVSGAVHGVILGEASSLDTAASRRLVRHLQWSSGWIEAFLRRSGGDDAARLGDRAAFLVHAVDAVAAAPRLPDAARIFAGLVADRFGCEQVAVGRSVGKRTAILAVSQTAVFDRRSRQAKAFAAAADEAIDQQTALAAPADGARQPFVMAAQEALSRASGGARVLTCPLVSRGTAIGAVTLVRRGAAFTQEAVDLLDALGSGIAPLLADKARSDRGLLALAFDRAREGSGKLVGRRHLGLKLAVLSVLAGGATLALAEQEYRIRARSEVQGEVRRMMSAPFDGFIRTARARAGDVVPEGAVLAELQDNDIVLDRLRHLSRKRQYQFELDKALARRDLAQTNIAEAQIAQADADLELADQMLARAQVRAPFEAVVVTGDLSQSIGRPVSRGDVLFEVTPLERYRITVVVPESEIRLVTAGMRGEVLLSALPERPFPFEIRSVTPVARVSEGVNGFEVIGSLTARDERIRPGMEGVAKIEAGTRSTFWIWTHPFWQWLRVKAWALVP